MKRIVRGLLDAGFWIVTAGLAWRFLAGTPRLTVFGNHVLTISNLDRPIRIAAWCLLLRHLAFDFAGPRDRALDAVLRRLSGLKEGIVAGTLLWGVLGVVNGATRALGQLVSERHLDVTLSAQVTRLAAAASRDGLWALLCGAVAALILWWLTGLGPAPGGSGVVERGARHRAACFDLFVLAATFGPWARPEIFELAPVPRLLAPRFVSLVAAAVLTAAAAWLLPRFLGPTRRPALATSAVAGMAAVVAAVYLFTSLPSVLFGGPAPLAGSRPSDAAEGASILLITIDTLRADHLGCYGYGRATSPEIDRLAAMGTRFERAYCTMPLTDPSHASLLTGDYPRTHGVLRNGAPIVDPAQVSHLPEWLARRGFVTAAITSRAHLQPVNLGVRGFDYYSVPAAENAIPAARTLQRAFDWLEANGNRRYFLWVHFFDPHFPYAPPPEFARRFLAGYRGTIDRGNTYSGTKYSPADVPYVVGLYDGEIAYADWAVGRLVQAVWERAGAGPRPLVVLTADHGESLGELRDRYDYVFAHGEFLYESQVHVPLIVVQPGRVPAGRVVHRVVENFSVAPTIAAAMGDPPDDYSCQAPSLWPWMEQVAADGHAVAASGEGDGPAAFIQRRYYEDPPQPYLAIEECGVVTDRVKLIHNLRRGPELFDLRDDPQELRNLAGISTAQTGQFLRRLEEWKRRYPLSAGAFGKIPQEKMQQLQGLGYIQ